MQERESSGNRYYDLDQHNILVFFFFFFFFDNRKTLRLAAALLHKVVDSLAPALTSMLVRGKEVCNYSPTPIPILSILHIQE